MSTFRWATPLLLLLNVSLLHTRGGAAATLSAAWAIAKLQIPVNLVLCIPLTENMPSGKATKPGDVVVASNGVTIEVDNTDAEGEFMKLAPTEFRGQC